MNRGTCIERHPWFHMPPHHRNVRIQWTTNFGCAKRHRPVLWFTHRLPA